MKSVYLDNAATTPIREQVIRKMTQSMIENFGNPSSTHSYGRSSKSIVELSRKQIAAHFNADPSEIIFTSGGTEADNLVLISSVRDLGVKRIISSRIEHHAVLHTIEELKDEYNVEIIYLDLNEKGEIDLEQLTELLQTDKPTLVSLMHVNNEIGNMIDLDVVAKICKAQGAMFHSDCVQSVGHFKINTRETPIDFFAASAHKFHGPKGVGFAFIRKGSGLGALIIGGEQERGMRAGTESVHNIVGLCEALNIAYDKLEEEKAYIKELKSHFIKTIKGQIPSVKFNGCSASMDKSTYTLVNVRLDISPERSAMLLFQLDLKGIACSKGSACQSGSNQGSHVLTEILDQDEAQKPSIRFSFSIYNTKEEIDYSIGILKELIVKILVSSSKC